MRKYEKPGIKSCSDADIGYTISECASVEPQVASETEGNSVDNCKINNDNQIYNVARTTTTIVKYDHDSTNESSNIEEVTPTESNTKNTCEENHQTLPKNTDFEVKIVGNQKDVSSIDDEKIQIKLTTSVQSNSTFRDDNWIFYGKKPTIESNESQKLQTTSSILLNNDCSSTDNTKYHNHTSAIDVIPSTQITNLDGNYYFTEDTTLRTLTNSSCHSDRSLVQLNLVCCEIDQLNEKENEKGSSRISEKEEDDSEENKQASKNLESLQTHLKCNLNQDSHALKSYSHLPSSFCSSYDSSIEKSFTNSCHINLKTSKKECCFNFDGKNEDTDALMENENAIAKKEESLEHKKQEAELSNILENMINEIEEHSTAESADEKIETINSAENEEEDKKNKNIMLLAALNAKKIGTIIYENRVNDSSLKQIANETNKKEKMELKVQTKDTEKQLISKSSKFYFFKTLKQRL